MRKSVFIFLIIVVAFCLWILLWQRQKQQSDLSVAQPTINQPVAELTPASQPTNYSPIETPTNAAVSAVPAIAVPSTNNAPLLNLLNVHTLDEWKAAVMNLGQTTPTSWVRAQFPTVPPMPFVIGFIPFNSDCVSIFTKDDSSYVRRIEIQSLTMNVADLRALGDSLLQTMGKDNTDFNAWCDKAGNNYAYSPLFDSASAHLPDGKVYGFSILCGFNGVKPWIINFVITDP